MKKLLSLMSILFVLFSFSVCTSGGKMKAIIETNMGTITIEFYEKDAPKTVKNFVDLAEKGFYDGLTFHRVIKGFVIQGGDPRGDGTGNPGYNIAAEFNKNPHVAGTVAMARGQDINSAGCQFYICLGRVPNLDGKYTVFGHVVDGMDVVYKIGEVKTSPNDKPVQPVTMKKVTIVRDK